MLGTSQGSRTECFGRILTSRCAHTNRLIKRSGRLVWPPFLKACQRWCNFIPTIPACRMLLTSVPSTREMRYSLPNFLKLASPSSVKCKTSFPQRCIPNQESSTSKVRRKRGKTVLVWQWNTQGMAQPELQTLTAHQFQWKKFSSVLLKHLTLEMHLQHMASPFGQQSYHVEFGTAVSFPSLPHAMMQNGAAREGRVYKRKPPMGYWKGLADDIIQTGPVGTSEA